MVSVFFVLWLLISGAVLDAGAEQPSMTKEWSPRVLAPVWRYAQDLAEADDADSVGLIDIEYAASVVLKPSVELRLSEARYLVHSMEGKSTPIAYTEIRRAEETDRKMLAGLAGKDGLRLPLSPEAREWLTRRSAVLRLACSRAPQQAETDWSALLADWSFFGFKKTGVEDLPTIGARSRAQSLKFLRMRAGNSGSFANPGLESAAVSVWRRAQQKAHDTQYLLTGWQIRDAIKEIYPDIAPSKSEDQDINDPRWWRLLVGITETRMRVNRRHEQEVLWTALDPNAATGLAALLGRLSQLSKPPKPAMPPGSGKKHPDPLFVDVTSVENIGKKSRHAQDLVTIGAACLDYDRDGLADLFIGGGKRFGGALYRNLGNFRFEEITGAAGLVRLGERASAADYDNDGWTDLIVLGDPGNPSRLYRNRGDGTFEDRTKAAGLGMPALLAERAVWFDADNDGDLDLYIVFLGRYVDGVTPHTADASNGSPNFYFSNNGDGTFTEATRESGLWDTGWGWAATAFDYDDDGWSDLYLCNVFGNSRLYRNVNGRFKKSEAGGAELKTLCKGVSAGDFNGDARTDMFLTMVGEPMDRAYRLDGRPRDILFEPEGFSGGRTKGRYECADRLLAQSASGGYEDAYSAAIGTATGAGWGWNGFFFDMNRDGWRDLYVVNGFYPDVLFYHDEHNRLYRFDPQANRFHPSPAGNGADIFGCSRGALSADFNNDGCLDLVVTGLHGARLLRGTCRNAKPNWMRLRLEGAGANRAGIGSRITVVSNGHAQKFDVGAQGGGSVDSFCGDIYVGLGDATRADNINVRWPGGSADTWLDVPGGRVISLKQGEGTPK